MSNRTVNKVNSEEIKQPERRGGRTYFVTAGEIASARLEAGVAPVAGWRAQDLVLHLEVRVPGLTWTRSITVYGSFSQDKDGSWKRGSTFKVYSIFERAITNGDLQAGDVPRIDGGILTNPEVALKLEGLTIVFCDYRTPKKKETGDFWFNAWDRVFVPEKLDSGEYDVQNTLSIVEEAFLKEVERGYPSNYHGEDKTEEEEDDFGFEPGEELPF